MKGKYRMGEGGSTSRNLYCERSMEVYEWGKDGSSNETCRETNVFPVSSSRHL